LVVFAANDMLGHDSVSQLVLNSCGEIMLSHPAGSIDFAVIHPLRERFEWTDLPKCTKEFAEMRTYGLSKKEDAYEIYGVAKDQGAVIVVRPDGYVGIISSLSSLDQVKGYLNNCLVSVS
jgi:phenol 2-monooxygenase